MRLRLAKKVCYRAVLWDSWYGRNVLHVEPLRGSTIDRAVRRAMKAKRKRNNPTD